MAIIARRFAPEFKQDVVTLAHRSNAAFEELTSDFGISVRSLAPVDEAGRRRGWSDGGPLDGGQDAALALRRRLRLFG